LRATSSSRFADAGSSIAGTSRSRRGDRSCSDVSRLRSTSVRFVVGLDSFDDFVVRSGSKSTLDVVVVRFRERRGRRVRSLRSFESTRRVGKFRRRRSRSSKFVGIVRSSIVDRDFVDRDDRVDVVRIRFRAFAFRSRSRVDDRFDDDFATTSISVRRERVSIDANRRGSIASIEFPIATRVSFAVVRTETKKKKQEKTKRRRSRRPVRRQIDRRSSTCVSRSARSSIERRRESPFDDSFAIVRVSTSVVRRVDRERPTSSSNSSISTSFATRVRRFRSFGRRLRVLVGSSVDFESIVSRRVRRSRRRPTSNVSFDRRAPIRSVIASKFDRVETFDFGRDRVGDSRDHRFAIVSRFVVRRQIGRRRSVVAIRRFRRILEDRRKAIDDSSFDRDVRFVASSSIVRGFARISSTASGSISIGVRFRTSRRVRRTGRFSSSNEETRSRSGSTIGVVGVVDRTIRSRTFGAYFVRGFDRVRNRIRSFVSVFAIGEIRSFGFGFDGRFDSIVDDSRKIGVGRADRSISTSSSFDRDRDRNRRVRTSGSKSTSSFE